MSGLASEVEPEETHNAIDTSFCNFAGVHDLSGKASSGVAVIAGFLFAAGWISGCKDPQERERAYVERGLQLFNAGDYEKGRVEFLNATRVHPANGRAWYYLGRIFERKKEWSQAREAFLRAVRHVPDHADAQFRLGRLLVSIGDLDEALARAERVIAIDPQNAGGYALKAVAYMGQEKYFEARKEAERALMLDPGDVNATVVIAEYFRRSDRIPEAIAVINEGLAQNPREPSLRVMKAALQVDREEPIKAVTELTALIELAPKNHHYRMGLARVYVLTGKVDLAEEVLREGVELDPKDSRAKLKLVEFLESVHGQETAELALNTFIADAPKDYRLRFGLEELYRRHERRQDAKRVLDEIVTFFPNTTHGLEAKARLAALHWLDGDSESANALISDVLDKEPLNDTALFTRAQIAFQQEAFDRASADLRAVLRGDPQSIRALTLLSNVHIQAGKRSLAIETLRQAIEVDPSKEAVRAALIDLLRRGGEHQQALQLVNEGLERSPESVRLLVLKGDLLLALHRYAEAQSVVVTLSGIADARYDAHRLKGKLFLRERHFERAAAEFAEARTIRPQATAPVVGQAHSLAALGRTDESIAALLDFAKRSPDHAVIWTELGDLYRRSGRPEDAARAYNKAVDLSPEDLGVYLRLAQIYDSQNRTDELLETVARGVAASPHNKSLALFQGIMLEKANRYGGAIASYERLFAALGDEFGRRDDNVLNLAVNNFAALTADHRTENEDALRRALALALPLQASSDPQSAYYLDTIGWLHYRLGAVSEALTFLKRAVASAPDNPTFHYHLGMAHSANGDTEAAREQFEKASAMDTEDTVVTQAREALASPPKR